MFAKNAPMGRMMKVRMNSTEMPQRIQRRRQAGWRMPTGAIYVGRPTRWGNPYRIEKISSTGESRPAMYAVIGPDGIQVGEPFHYIQDAKIFALQCYEKAAITWDLGDLRGKNLACWCPLDEPCHADVLLRLANKEDE